MNPLTVSAADALVKAAQLAGESWSAFNVQELADYTEEHPPIHSKRGLLAHTLPALHRRGYIKQVDELVMLTTTGFAAAMQMGPRGVPPEEFLGIDTAPNDPRHAQQVIDHIAHLEEPQIKAIRDALNSWEDHS